MQTLSTKLPTTTITNFQNRKVRRSLWQKYISYAETQSNQNIYWYMKVIITIPCVFMVLSILAMAELTVNFEWLIGLNMLLFFVNVIIHIAEVKSTIFVPIYHLTIATMMLIPAITYLITLN